MATLTAPADVVTAYPSLDDIPTTQPSVVASSADLFPQVPSHVPAYFPEAPSHAPSVPVSHVPEAQSDMLMEAKAPELPSSPPPFREAVAPTAPPPTNVEEEQSAAFSEAVTNDPSPVVVLNPTVSPTLAPPAPAPPVMAQDYTTLYQHTAPQVLTQSSYPSLGMGEESFSSTAAGYPSLDVPQSNSPYPTFAPTHFAAVHVHPVGAAASTTDDVGAPPPSYQDFMEQTSMQPQVPRTQRGAAVISTTDENGGMSAVNGGASETIQISKNMQMQMVQTPDNVEEGELKKVQCISCNQWLQVLKEAKMVYCPTCTTVSSCADVPPPPARKLTRQPWYSCFNKVFS